MEFQGERIDFRNGLIEDIFGNFYMDFSMEFQGERIDFRKGETIHTENSYKYSIDEFEEILHEAGFSRTTCLTDQRKYYGIFISDP
ncbi:MAG: L-histidine N(alpha)-methyltransferase [Candidatus Thermoplasmatota archaeon]|nr:L-histidine N(alpha)-methyltransferase [Candidatus Thermoplasmatota archaeon]